MRAGIAAVLFDLDGTLIDSAPDLAGAANTLRAEHGLDAMPYEPLRAMVGSGARGMISVAFGIGPGHDRFEALKDAFLDRYESRLLAKTRVFDAMAPVLHALDRAGRPWGIVTNKAMRYAAPVIEGLGLHQRAAVVIAGDTTVQRKPHPEPLLEAARRMRIQASDCVYIGDDPRDIQAGRSAGMATLAAAWGYLGESQNIDEWGADHVLAQPNELLHWLELA